MDLKNLIKKHKNKTFNIAIIILALIVANNIYKSQARNIRLLVERKDTEIKKNELLEEISQLEKKLSAFKQAVNKKDISQIPNRLNRIAQDSSVKITSLRPQSQRDYFTYIKYPFALIITSPDYHCIGKFISKIENSPDFYKVEDIKIRQSTKSTTKYQEDKTDKLTAELRLSTILIKD